MGEERIHKPVLLKEVIEALNVKRGKKYIDATVGEGGHTKKILEKGGIVLAIDSDWEALKKLKTKNEKGKTTIKNKKLILEGGNFRDLEKIAKKHGFDKVAGVLFDLGLSSWQIEKSGRGFSYLRDEPLDMRMDLNQELTAADLINNLKKDELNEIFARFGEETYSQEIAEGIVSVRPLKTTKELARAVGGDFSSQARVFQALRIAVNNEINNLKRALPQAVRLLGKKGRLVIISFHSLEDRVVKFSLRRKDLRLITQKPIRPSQSEIKVNFRARSARLRVAEKR